MNIHEFVYALCIHDITADNRVNTTVVDDNSACSRKMEKISKVVLKKKKKIAKTYLRAIANRRRSGACEHTMAGKLTNKILLTVVISLRIYYQKKKENIV